MVTRVAVATHGDVERLMRRPYYRTLWTFLQLKEHERIESLKERAHVLNLAGLIAIAFHEPKKLSDEYHRFMADAGMQPTPEQAIEKAQDVIEAMRRIDAGELKTVTLGEAPPEANGGR